MMVDTQDEMVVQPTISEKDQIAEINPEQLDNDTETLENVTLANDCMYRTRLDIDDGPFVRRPMLTNTVSL